MRERILMLMWGEEEKVEMGKSVGKRDLPKGALLL